MISALIAPMMNLVGTGIDYFANKEAQRKEHDQQMEMWNKTNEYNTPLQQRLRMIEGGFNPNHGLGSMQNTASNQQMPKHQKLDTAGITGAGTALTNAFNQSLQTEGQFVKNMADADRITEQGALTREQREQLEANKSANIELRSQQLAGAKLDNIRKGIDNMNIPEKHKQAIKESVQRITNLKSVLSSQQLQQELMREDLQLRKQGINPQDHILWRIFGKHWQNAKGYLKSQYHPLKL